MNAKHIEVAIKVLAGGVGEIGERAREALERDSITGDQLGTAIGEVLSAVSDNDIEGAAIGIAAVSLAYPDHDADEYVEACNRVIELRCPLLRLESKFELPIRWHLKVDEIMDMIYDGAERIQAGFPLAI